MAITTKIAAANSLYAHSEQLIEQFNTLIAVHEPYLFRFDNTIKLNSPVNFYSTIFNYWVQLIDTDELRVPKVEKLIFHTFAFEMNKYLADNPLTTKFLKTHRSADERFVFCYFFGYHFLYYMHVHMPKELLERFMQQKDLIQLFATKDSDLQNKILQDIYTYRKELLADIRTNMQTRFDIQQLIIQATDKTERYFQYIQKIT